MEYIQAEHPEIALLLALWGKADLLASINCEEQTWELGLSMCIALFVFLAITALMMCCAMSPTGEALNSFARETHFSQPMQPPEMIQMQHLSPMDLTRQLQYTGQMQQMQPPLQMHPQLQMQAQLQMQPQP